MSKRVLVACLLLVSVFVQSSQLAQAQTSVTLTAAADNYPDSKYPIRAYGTRPVLYVGNSYDHAQKIWGSERIYIRFDLSQMPKGQVILQATLRLWQFYAPVSNQTYETHRVLADWNEKTESWDKQPTWAEAKTSETIAPAQTEVPVEWDITSDVKAWYYGEAQNYGTMIKVAKEANVADASSGFWSREYPVDEWKPRLTIILGGSPTLTYAVSIGVTGLPSNVTSTILVDGEPHAAISSASREWILLKKGTTHTVSVSTLLSGSKGTRYKCEACQLQVTDNAALAFSYSTEYLVTFSTHPSDMFEAPPSGWYENGTILHVKRTGPDYVNVTPGVRLAFVGWYLSSGNGTRLPTCACLSTVIVNKSIAVEGLYGTEYYLNVLSPVGETEGSGWYPNGTVALFSVDREAVVASGILGSLGLRRSFDHWVGSENFVGPSNQPQGSIIVKAPANIEAVWKDDWTTLVVNPVMLLAIAVILLAVTVYRRFRRNQDAKIRA
jgi:hypothetical protein